MNLDDGKKAVPHPNCVMREHLPFRRVCAVWLPQSSPPSWATSVSVSAAILQWGQTVLGFVGGCALEAQRQCLPTGGSLHLEKVRSDRYYLHPKEFVSSAIRCGLPFILSPASLPGVLQQAHDSGGVEVNTHAGDLTLSSASPSAVSSTTPSTVLKHFRVCLAKWREQERGINQFVREKVIKAHVIKCALCR